jgi:hypothetical protein
MTDTNHHTDADLIELHPDDFSVEDLRAVLFEGSERLPKVFALSLMRRKDYPDMVADLERVVVDESETAATRRHAAIELARVGSSEAVSALRRAAAVENPAVRETVVRHLAGIPGGLETARPSVAAWQAKLAAVRQGAPEGRMIVPTPERLLTIDPRAVVEVGVESLAPQEVQRAVEHAAGAEAEQSAAEGALAFRARDTSVLFLPSVRRPPTAIEALLQGPAVLGSVLVRHTEEVDHWEVAFHVIAQPSEGKDNENGIDIFVVKPWGDLTFFGRATTEDPDGDRAFRFRMSAVEAPGAFPIDVAGRISRRGVDLDHVRVGTVASTVTPQPRPR